MTRLLAGATLVALLSLGAGAQTEGKNPVVARELGNDRFVAGCPIRIEKAVGGDAFLAGCSIDVDAAIGGDAIVTGGHVRIAAPIGQSLYSAAGRVQVDADVARNARVAGGQVEFGPKSSVGGNVSIAGGNVRINGSVKGYVTVAGGNVYIDGPVEGNVIATAGAVELGPNARIKGQLRYGSQDEMRRDPAAQVQGSVERMPMHADRAPHRHGGGWVWSLGLMLIAAVLVAAMPSVARQVADTWRTRTAMSLLLGFIAFVCIPVAALILLITIVGIPLALASVALYLALLLAGYVFTGISVGDWALARLKPDRVGSVGWRAAAAALGMLSVSLLGRLPFIGALIVFAALLVGLGALVMQVRRQAPAA